MTYKKICDEYAFYTGKTSDVVRQLAFAGIAVVWIFKQDINGHPQIPGPYRWALGLLILTLIFDFLQYVAGAVLWRAKERAIVKTAKEEAKVEHKPIDEVNVKVAKWINYPTEAMFCLKVVGILGAYVYLLIDAWTAIA